MLLVDLSLGWPLLRLRARSMIRGLGSRPGHGANEQLAVGLEPEIRVDVRLVCDGVSESFLNVFAHVGFGEMRTIREAD